MRMLVDRHHRAIVWRGNVPTLMAAVPIGTREAMEDRLTALRKVLMPANSMADRDQIGAALTRMFSRYLNTGSATNKLATVAAYIAALSAYPIWAVLAAIDEVERGAVDGMSPDFPPSAPRLCQIAEGHMALTREEKAKIEAVLDARVDDRPERDPAESARVGAQMRALADGTAARVALEQVESDRRQRERAAASIARTETMILAEYRHHGIEPVMCNGRPIPLATARYTETNDEKTAGVEPQVQSSGGGEE